MSELLRLGVVVPAGGLPRWAVEGLGHAVRAELAILSAQLDGPAPKTEASFRRRLFTRIEQLALTASDSMVPRRSLPPMGEGGPLDLVVCFGEGDLEELARQAKLGAGRWRIFEPGTRSSVASIVFEFHARGGARSYFVELGSTVDLRSLPATLHRAEVVAEEAIPRALRIVIEHGLGRLLNGAVLVPPEAPPSSLARAAVAEIAWAVQRRAIPEEWFIGLRRHRPDRAPWSDPVTYIPFEPPRGSFYADPFLFRHEERSHLFFELGSIETGRGVIAHTELDADGRPGGVQTVLDLPPHLAYPNVFERDGQIWMLPDRGSANSLDLFRAVEFPLRWEKVATVMDGVRIGDATLLDHEGKLWLFASILPGAGLSWDELHLFHADRMEGPWTPHALNPVLVDSRRARPAGKIFLRDGRIVRPSQDCTRSEGCRLMFNEIERLTPNDYRERTLASLEPTWLRGLVGTRTYNSDGIFEAIDTRRQVLRLPPRLARLAGTE